MDITTNPGLLAEPSNPSSSQSSCHLLLSLISLLTMLIHLLQKDSSLEDFTTTTPPTASTAPTYSAPFQHLTDHTGAFLFFLS